MEELISIKEAAEILGLRVSQVRRFVHSRRLVPQRTGGWFLRFKKSDVEKFGAARKIYKGA